MCSSKRNYTPKTHSPICYHTNYPAVCLKTYCIVGLCAFCRINKYSMPPKGYKKAHKQQVYVSIIKGNKCGIFILSYQHQIFNPLYKNPLFFSCFWYAIMKKSDSGGKAYEKRKQRRSNNPF